MQTKPTNKSRRASADAERTVEGVALDKRLAAADAAFHECIESSAYVKPVAGHKAKSAYLKAVCAVLAECIDRLTALAGRIRDKHAEERHDLHGVVMGEALFRVKQLLDLALSLYAKRMLRLYRLELAQAKFLEVQRVFLEVHDLLAVPAVLQQVADKFDALEECAKRRCDFGDCHSFPFFL